MLLTNVGVCRNLPRFHTTLGADVPQISPRLGPPVHLGMSIWGLLGKSVDLGGQSGGTPPQITPQCSGGPYWGTIWGAGPPERPPRLISRTGDSLPPDVAPQMFPPDSSPQISTSRLAPQIAPPALAPRIRVHVAPRLNWGVCGARSGRVCMYSAIRLQHATQ